jgi:hypothetical protein
MRFLGQTRLSTLELPNELQFEIVRERGWSDTLFWFVIALFPVWLFYQGNESFGIVALIAELVGLAATWVHGPVTRLRVRDDELIATGNLERTFTDEVHIPTNEVKSIEWGTLGEEGPTGLWVHHGWRSTCVLPGLDKDQAQRIIASIARHFPGIAIDSSSGFSLLGESEIITLGISGGGQRNKSETGR